MKKLILIFLLALIIVPATTWAQQPSSKETAKVIVLKRNFFKDSLNLNVDVSNLFWNKFDVFENREAVFHEEFKNDMESHGIDLRKNTKLTKEQSVYVIKKKLEMKEKILGLDQERFDAYEKILPAEDLIRYFDLDQKFKTEMTKKFEAAKQIQKSNDTQSLQITTPASTVKSTNLEAHPQQK
ncbi:MAG: hypothetical protein J5719_04765 [Bacteroidales bacterium]|nr:hypothetical protein [Bacteroidales bacterium]